MARCRRARRRARLQRESEAGDGRRPERAAVCRTGRHPGRRAFGERDRVFHRRAAEPRAGACVRPADDGAGAAGHDKASAQRRRVDVRPRRLRHVNRAAARRPGRDSGRNRADCRSPGSSAGRDATLDAALAWMDKAPLALRPPLLLSSSDLHVRNSTRVRSAHLTQELAAPEIVIRLRSAETGAESEPEMKSRREY